MRGIVLAAIVVAIGYSASNAPLNAAGARCNFSEGDSIELVGTVTDRGNSRDREFSVAIETVALAKCPDAYVRIMVETANIPETCTSGKAISGSGRVTNTQDIRGKNSTIHAAMGIEFFLVESSSVTCQ